MSFTAFSDQVDPEKIIKNIPFWPDLNLSIFQADYRLPAEYRVSMPEDRLILAVVWANGRSCSGRGTAIPRPFFNAKIRPALVYKRRSPFPQKTFKISSAVYSPLRG